MLIFYHVSNIAIQLCVHIIALFIAQLMDQDVVLVQYLDKKAPTTLMLAM